MRSNDSNIDPFVSIVIPVRNEAGFIATLLEMIFAQDYPPDRFEVIVADGLSTDGTRSILADCQLRYPELTVVDNPGRIVPTALNLAIAKARGDLIVRIDGHALIERDFVSQNVALLSEHPEAWSVGGPIRHVGSTSFGKAVAIAMSHPIGVGNALHRYPDYEGYVESAQFPAIRRWVFDRVGMFDERLVRNQDDEFNYRIRRAGGKIYVSPRIRYSYFVRSQINRLFQQFFQYGFWRVPVMEKHRCPTSVRQLIPTLFYLACVVFGVAGYLWSKPTLSILLPIVYLVALVLAGLSASRSERLTVRLYVPIAIATMHLAYSAGLSFGLWARVFRPTAWNSEGRMTAISR